MPTQEERNEDYRLDCLELLAEISRLLKLVDKTSASYKSLLLRAESQILKLKAEAGL